MVVNDNGLRKCVEVVRLAILALPFGSLSTTSPIHPVQLYVHMHIGNWSIKKNGRMWRKVDFVWKTLLAPHQSLKNQKKIIVYTF